MRTITRAKTILALSVCGMMMYGNLSAQNVSASAQNVSAGPDQHLCGGTAVLSATITSNGEVGTWSEPTGRVTFDDPHKNNTIVRGIPKANQFRLLGLLHGTRKLLARTMFLSSTKNQLSFLLKAGKTTKKPNNKASTITVADLNVGETTVWLTISNTKYDNCIS